MSHNSVKSNGICNVTLINTNTSRAKKRGSRKKKNSSSRITTNSNTNNNQISDDASGYRESIMSDKIIAVYGDSIDSTVLSDELSPDFSVYSRMSRTSKMSRMSRMSKRRNVNRHTRNNRSRNNRSRNNKSRTNRKSSSKSVRSNKIKTRAKVKAKVKEKVKSKIKAKVRQTDDSDDEFLSIPEYSDTITSDSTNDSTSDDANDNKIEKFDGIGPSDQSDTDSEYMIDIDNTMPENMNDSVKDDMDCFCSEPESYTITNETDETDETDEKTLNADTS